MGLYGSTNDEVEGFRGLYRDHFIGSNCSPCVRIALEKKGVTRTSYRLKRLREGSRPRSGAGVR